jgi:hypothetical protein
MIARTQKPPRTGNPVFAGVADDSTAVPWLDRPVESVLPHLHSRSSAFICGSFFFIKETSLPLRVLDRSRSPADDPSHDRGAFRTVGRDFPTRGKNPSNLKRVMPPEGVGGAMVVFPFPSGK